MPAQQEILGAALHAMIAQDDPAAAARIAEAVATPRRVRELARELGEGEGESEDEDGGGRLSHGRHRLAEGDGPPPGAPPPPHPAARWSDEDGQWLVGDDPDLPEEGPGGAPARLSEERTDSAGRRYCYEEGRGRVPCPDRDERKAQRKARGREEKEESLRKRLQSPPQVVLPSHAPTRENVDSLLGEVLLPGQQVTPEELAAFAGGLPGAEVSVQPHVRHEWDPGRGDYYGYATGVQLTIDHPWVQDQIRDVNVGADGTLYMHNALFFLKKKYRGGGTGLKVFTAQVRSLAAAGIDEIRTTAGKGGIMNGYYTWPRLGYDAQLEDVFKRRLQNSKVLPPDSPAREAATVQELMATPEGRAYWKKYGYMTDMTFDLRKGSKSLEVLNAYLAAKGQPVVEVPDEAEARRQARREQWPEAKAKIEQRRKEGRALRVMGASQAERDNARRVLAGHHEYRGLEPTPEQRAALDRAAERHFVDLHDTSADLRVAWLRAYAEADRELRAGRLSHAGRHRLDQWARYQGPHGGTGWKNTQTGEVVYGDKPGGGAAGKGGGPAGGLPAPSPAVRRQLGQTVRQTAGTLLQAVRDLPDDAQAFLADPEKQKQLGRVALSGLVAGARMLTVGMWGTNVLRSAVGLVKTLGNLRIVGKAGLALAGRAQWTGDDTRELLRAVYDVPAFAGTTALDWGLPGTGVILPTLYRTPYLKEVFPRALTEPGDDAVSRLIDRLEALTQAPEKAIREGKVFSHEGRTRLAEDDSLNESQVNVMLALTEMTARDLAHPKVRRALGLDGGNDDDGDQAEAQGRPEGGAQGGSQG